MTDIDNDTELRVQLAACGWWLRRDGRLLLAARRIAAGGKDRDREDGAERQSGVPQINHDARIPSMEPGLPSMLALVRAARLSYQKQKSLLGWVNR